MTIDWENLTLWSSLAGDVLIGFATAIFLFINSRIASISGILGWLLRPVKSDIYWRAAFVAGLIFSPIHFRAAAPLPAVQIDADAAPLIMAGLCWLESAPAKVQAVLVDMVFAVSRGFHRVRW